MGYKRFSAAVILICVAVGLTGCTRREGNKSAADAVAREDYTSVYSAIGREVSPDMVEEDERGLAFVELDGVRYELGLDFLSMAMVYNTSHTSERFPTAESAYNEWWRLYIQRWNYLVPEVPLYSNRYYDIYNSKIQGFKTTPYLSVADAIVSASVAAGRESRVILGSTTALTGAFRNAAWGKSSAGSADLDVQKLTSGHSLVLTGADGGYLWNASALDGIPEGRKNADGSFTYTIKIRKDLTFSDSSPIDARHYIAELVASSTPVAIAAGGTGGGGLTLLGYSDFRAYDGHSGTGERYFDGVRLIDKYTLSLTFSPEYADYYYLMSYAALTPSPLQLYLGSGELVTDGGGRVGLSDVFYRREVRNGAESYITAEQIRKNLSWDSGLPWSGPYTVIKFDVGTLTATLKRNPYYGGDDVRGRASIESLVYLKVESETQMNKLRRGEIDVIGGITGGVATAEALKVVRESAGAFSEVHYDRAGYGKLGFRCDLGPTSFAEVRRAVMYTINRPEFAATFTGGFGTIVHGPYYTGYSAYLAVKDNLKLNRYIYSSDAAIEELVRGGWIYNSDGTPYDGRGDGIRYKRLEGFELTEDNIFFRSTDGRYETLKLEDGSYYMPLVINWFGTQPNEVTDQLITSWQTSKISTRDIGMYITYTSCDFTGGLYAEYMQSTADGFDGVPKLNAINFATGFEGASYDYSFAWTVNPELYASGYSVSYLMDTADFMSSFESTPDKNA